MAGTLLEADYLVIGSGAMAMAFTDVLLQETNATVIMVDRHHQPGGHWNDAYPYVRLHQPSAFYGVNSKSLGSHSIDEQGWNKGLYELATNSEIVAYFDQVMNQGFLRSGRVQYFSSCEYLGEGRFKSLMSGAEWVVKSNKVVDTTYMNVTVPSIREPDYTIARGVACVPPNELPKARGRFDDYIVIGAGKTGMDACLFLLRNEVDPERICWIMPRDSWMLDRANIQPGELFATSIGRSFAEQLEDIVAAESIDDLFYRVEQRGGLIRLDPDIVPTMYRCATVTHAELEQLRRINNIIRAGRVKAIETDVIRLDSADQPTHARTLHVDCTADGLERRPEVPIFNGSEMTLQTVRTCQQVFSAAFIAHIEAAYQGDEVKNELCTPVPHPDSDVDFLHTTLANTLNGLKWRTDPELQNWLLHARLDGFTNGDAPQPDLADPKVAAQIDKIWDLTQQSVFNLERLLGKA